MAILRVSNIDGLQTTIAQEKAVPKPENLAAQFIAIDSLQYLFRAFVPDKIAMTMWNIVTRPYNVDGEIFDTLRDQRVLHSSLQVDQLSFIYEVTVGGLDEKEWQFKVAHVKDEEKPLGELFKEVNWGGVYW